MLKSVMRVREFLEGAKPSSFGYCHLLLQLTLQIAVMKTRMLPIGKVFNKFPRMIRDLTRESLVQENGT